MGRNNGAVGFERSTTSLKRRGRFPLGHGGTLLESVAVDGWRSFHAVGGVRQGRMGFHRFAWFAAHDLREQLGHRQGRPGERGRAWELTGREKEAREPRERPLGGSYLASTASPSRRASIPGPPSIWAISTCLLLPAGRKGNAATATNQEARLWLRRFHAGQSPSTQPRAAGASAVTRGLASISGAHGRPLLAANRRGGGAESHSFVRAGEDLG